MEINVDLPPETLDELKKLKLYREQIEAVFDLLEELYLWPGAIDRETVFEAVPGRIKDNRRNRCLKAVPPPGKGDP